MVICVCVACRDALSRIARLGSERAILFDSATGFASALALGKAQMLTLTRGEPSRMMVKVVSRETTAERLRGKATEAASEGGDFAC